MNLGNVQNPSAEFLKSFRIETICNKKGTRRCLKEEVYQLNLASVVANEAPMEEGESVGGDN